jgi:hypothetical protein
VSLGQESIVAFVFGFVRDFSIVYDGMWKLTAALWS